MLVDDVWRRTSRCKKVRCQSCRNTKVSLHRLIPQVFTEILNQVSGGAEVRIWRFGRFLSRKRKPKRVVANFADGKAVEIPEAERLVFRASDSANRRINAKGKATGRGFAVRYSTAWPYSVLGDLLGYRDGEGN
jgi:nucleoid DNA-binding protein